MRQYFQPTPEQIAKLKGWLYDGLSLTQIGNKLGVTRNVISGVIWRRPPLRAIQKQRSGASSHWQQVRPHPQPAQQMINKYLEVPVSDIMEDEPDPPVKPDEPAAPETVGVLLKDLGHNMCKYPLAWDREATGHYWFCGHETRPDQIYCEKHEKKIRQAQPTSRGTTR